MADPNKPGVFVTVPSYNHGRFVERTLRSIFSQSLVPERLLVIDDGSTDDSAAVIERTLNDCPFPCELIVRENRGLCRTLNESFANCREEYFAYLGSDDLWAPEFLEVSIGKLGDYPKACLSFSNIFLVDEDDFIIDDTVDWHHFRSGNQLGELLNGHVPLSPSVVYRSEFLPAAPWNEYFVLEDYDLYFRLAEHYDFAFNKEPLSAWRQHGRNTSGHFPSFFPVVLEIHQAAMDRLGLSEAEKRRHRSRLCFEASFNFIRNGFRSEAIRYMIGNPTGAESWSRFLNLALRIAIPQRIFQWIRNRRTRAKRELRGKFEYGK